MIYVIRSSELMTRVPHMADWSVRQCFPQQCCRRGNSCVGSVPEATEVPNDNTAREITINHCTHWHARQCFPQQSCLQGKFPAKSVPVSTGVPNDNCSREGTLCSFNCCGATVGCGILLLLVTFGGHDSPYDLYGKMFHGFQS